MAKRHLKKVKKKEPETGLRHGVLKFTRNGGIVEHLKVRALRHKLDENINAHYRITELGIRVELLNRELDRKDLTPDMKQSLLDAVAKASTEFYDAQDWAATEKVMHMVQKPNEWFDDLAKEDLESLKRSVLLWGMMVDANELGFEIIQHLYYLFGTTKAKSTFSGEEVAQMIDTLKMDYITLKKKPKCLDTVLRSVKQEIVEDALTHTLPGHSG